MGYTPRPSNEGGGNDDENFIQSRLEQQVREACALHGWSAAITVADPVDVLILLEELESDDIPTSHTQGKHHD
jgi:hypothetical protein